MPSNQALSKADAVSMSMKPGYLVSSAIFVVIFTVLLVCIIGGILILPQRAARQGH